MPRCRRILSIAAVLALAPSHAEAQTTRDSVLAVVADFFRYMTAHDTAGSRALLLSGGQWVSLRHGGDSVVTRRTTFEEYLTALGQSPERWAERIWQPTVLVDDDVAVVWAPYDFHRDGKFSHCGTDTFSLVRTAGRWRIGASVYTVVPTGCAPSPLGPLRE